MSRCVRQWRYLKDLKRGGAGHTTTAVGELDPGSLAVECPACPHPERNLPVGWDTNPSKPALVVGATTSASWCSNGYGFRWIYALFLAIDANFRLKLKARGIKDPELGTGLAYFVDTTKFQEHIKNHSHEEDESLPSLRCKPVLTISIDGDLRGRVPCGQPSEFEVVQGFFGFWCRRNRLPPWLGSQKRCGRPPKRRTVGHASTPTASANTC